MIDFGGEKRVEIYKVMNIVEAAELIDNETMCAVCLMPFEKYKNLDESQQKLKMVRSKIENMIEKQDEEDLSPDDVLFNQKPPEKTQSIYRLRQSSYMRQDSSASDCRNSIFTKQGFRHYHQ